jgi:hypothetical protein
MDIHKDDMNMIGEPAIKGIVDLEFDPVEYARELHKLTQQEPIAWAWISESRDEDIQAIAMTFPNIMNIFPTLPIYINNILIRSFIRGLKMGEFKWRIESPQIKGELAREGEVYIPKLEDFK